MFLILGQLPIFFVPQTAIYVLLNMENLSYEQAFEELQTIVLAMEGGAIGIDDLSIKVKRAAELIKFCQHKLKTTEMDVDQILKDMETGPSENPL
jgi:exodeoxyribonuclease VII small subunit